MKRGRENQIREIVKCGKDPLYFINNYVQIQHPGRGTVKFKTYPFQDECLSDFLDHRFNIVLKARQLGMSTLTAAYAAWLALFHKDKRILIIATKLEVAINFMKKVKFLVKRLPSWIILPSITSDNRQSMEFSHGSSIRAIPTSDDAGRSESLSLLIIDEAAFIRNFDDLWTGLYPTLSSGGRVAILSTPNGVGGMYHKLYTDAEAGINEFNPIRLMWDVHPERGQEWFDNESKNLGSQRKVAQELLCDFVASGGTFLSAEDIEWIRINIKDPIERVAPDRNLWVWYHPLSEHKYIISSDVSRGDSADFSTFHVIDTTTDTLVAEYRGKIPPDRLAELLCKTGHTYNKALLCPENNSYGYATIMKLKEMNYPRIYNSKKNSLQLFNYVATDNLKNLGFNTSGKSRPQILAKLEEAIRNKQILIHSSRFYDEIKTFIFNNGRAQAMRGHHDDLVMSMAIGLWLFETSGDHGKGVNSLNNAMLKAMSVSNTEFDSPQTPKKGSVNNPFLPFRDYSTFRDATPEEIQEKFWWVLGK